VLRAALHIHSVWSYDGHWTLERIAEVFADRRYDLLFVTEHDQGFTEERRQRHRDACRSASTGLVTIIPGIEYSDPSNVVHTLVWGDVPFLGTGQETMRVLERATGQGGVCVFAHPSRRAAWKVFRREWLKHIAGIEIWNRKTDGWSPSPEAAQLISDTGARSVVGIDFHSAKEMFPLALRFQDADQREECSVLEALRMGSYRCEAFGMDVRAFAGGVGGHASSLLESGRRRAARVYRFLKQRRSARPEIATQEAGRDQSGNIRTAAESAKKQGPIR
jgi:hypothetical protein